MYAKMFRLLLLAVGMTVAANAGATVTFYDGLEGGSGDVENVLLDGGPTNLVGPALNVKGTTNQSDLIVDFTSTSSIRIQGGGQAFIEGNGGANFDDIAIVLNDVLLGFTKIQFNIDAALDGDVDITAHWIDGMVTSMTSSTRNLDANGQNFFTAIATDGQIMTGIDITSSDPETNLVKLEQVRLFVVERNGTPVTDVPEPLTALLMGMGLLGVGIARRRRRA